MNTVEKIAFVNELIDTVKARLMTHIHRLPDDWHGKELRQLLADRFAEQASMDSQHQRMKDYRNFMDTHSF